MRASELAAARKRRKGTQPRKEGNRHDWARVRQRLCHCACQIDAGFYAHLLYANLTGLASDLDGLAD